MKGVNNIGQENLKYFYRSRNLPHKYDIDKPIFITYRLKFTLPKSIIEALEVMKQEWNSELQSLTDIEKKKKIQTRDHLFFSWFDEFLTKSSEVPQLLHRADLTNIIKESFHFFDNQHYQLLAYCIMPNHVHVLIIPVTQQDGDIYSPSHITYTWKKYTAYRINSNLNREGSLWHHESYDHLINSDYDLYHALEYIIENPVKAGLVSKWTDWNGTWIRDDLKPVQIP